MGTISDPVTDLTTRLKEISSRNNADIVYDKIHLIKQKNNNQETINVLEEIVNDLISDKNELLQITKSYEEEFLTRDISDDDIEYITRELLPIVTTFLPFTGGDNEFVSSIKKLVSSETLKILKLLGFNYKEAIGQPLTNLVSQLIQQQTNKLTMPKTSKR